MHRLHRQLYIQLPYDHVPSMPKGRYRVYNSSDHQARFQILLNSKLFPSRRPPVSQGHFLHCPLQGGHLSHKATFYIVPFKEATCLTWPLFTLSPSRRPPVSQGHFLHYKMLALWEGDYEPPSTQFTKTIHLLDCSTNPLHIIIKKKVSMWQEKMLLSLK